ncbi:MAG: preprotein translocase subunit SecA, partial [Bacteroidales bacterium]|nr:preprotein translocase subunit SecA [Bacteroidales bacterium]
MFGSKADRDYKAVKPILDKILAVYPSIDALSNDELRASSEELKQYLQKVEEPFEKRIAEILEELVEEKPIAEKIKLASEHDRLVKDEDEAIEKALNEVLPKAFAIVKSTARRFKENSTVEVVATEFDKLLAVDHDFVTIEGDKAIYKNSWEAGGNIITWDMVHY